MNKNNKVHKDDIIHHYATARNLYPVKRLVELIETREFKRVRALNKLLNKLQYTLNMQRQVSASLNKSEPSYARYLKQLIVSDFLALVDSKFKVVKHPDIDTKSEEYCYHAIRGAVLSIMKNYNGGNW